MLNQTKVLVMVSLFSVVLNGGMLMAKGEKEEADKCVKDKFRVSRFAFRHIELPVDLPESFAISAEHHGKQKELYFWKRSVRSADYKVVGPKNGKYHHFDPGSVRTYIDTNGVS